MSIPKVQGKPGKDRSPLDLSTYLHCVLTFLPSHLSRDRHIGPNQEDVEASRGPRGGHPSLPPAQYPSLFVCTSPDFPWRTPFPTRSHGSSATDPQLLPSSWSETGSRIGTRPQLTPRNASQSVVEESSLPALSGAWSSR